MAEGEGLRIIDFDINLRCGAGVNGDDVLPYRGTAKKFGSERDSEASAGEIRRPRIEG